MPAVIPDRPAHSTRTGARSASGQQQPSHAGTVATVRRAAGRITVLTAVQTAVMIGLGLLITGPAHGLWPLAHEDAVDEGLEGIRTSGLTAVSFVASEAGNTLTVIIGTVLACLALVLIPHRARWREAIFLSVGVALQSLVFLFITLAVDRRRPEVDRLDASPPTSSYTSGHTGAATALYAGLAVLALSRIRGPWRRIVGCLLLLIPLLVASARLYRGMHHPTDVMGGMLNGALSLLIVGSAVLTRDPHGAPAPDGSAGTSAPDGTDGTDGTGQRRGLAVVVYNPLSAGAATLDTVRRSLARHGYADARLVATTADDPGYGQCAAARDAGAALVVVCGGDGTVQAAADALADSGVPLAVVPCGTGNLLARNLDLPLTPAKALDGALSGTAHRLDLGRVEGDGLPATHFTAMSGAGLDAAVMDGTGERAKAVIGWAAYVLSVLRNVRSPRTELTLRLDGERPLRRSARMVLIANVGTLQGGICLVPAARPDDGALDLLVLDPHGVRGWLGALTTLFRGAPAAPATERAHAGEPSAAGPVEYFRFRRAEIEFDTGQPREIDGDPVAPGRFLRAEVRPGALTVLLPAGGN
ncbi:diacylglycerol kinase family protein [Streptomyces sp. NPDC088785]|uniref:diacylglycerol kinase family protein n=1 Tax=Streptomyces sp. NPDC088785 TaxID=3365897 RepID=UPI003800212A